MDWKYVRPIEDDNALEALQSKLGRCLPEMFVKTVQAYNGGRPQKKLFITDSGKEREIKRLLSVNKDDSENIWNAFMWEVPDIQKDYLIFAIDSFGNHICLKNDNSVVFVDHESSEEENVAKSFEDFLAKLYS